MAEKKPRRNGPPPEPPPIGVEERALPSNLEAERSVLGAILLHNEALAVLGDTLKAADFFRDAHRRIFASMLKLVEMQRPIELVTLREELKRTGDLEEVGGPAYISALVDGVPRSTNIAHYAAIVAEKSRLRSAIYTANKLSKMAYGAEERSADIVSAAAEELSAIGGSALEGQAVFLRDLLPAGMEALERAVQNKSGSVTGIRTGFSALDDMTAGLQPGDLTLIAARTSQGKTALAMNLARVIGESVPLLIFSLEMSKEQLFMRMLASESRVDSHRIRSGFLMDKDWTRIATAIETLNSLKILIDDHGNLTVRQFAARARQVKAHHGLGAIVVDYIQLMRGQGNFENRTQEIGTISRGLKAAAKELGVPVIALAQLSRAAEPQPGRKARRPQLSDLAESGSLENDADVVLLIYRPEPKDDEVLEVAEIIVAKQRNGPTGVVKLAWNREIVRFENIGLPT